MCFNRLQNQESGVSMEGHLSDSEGQKVFIGRAKECIILQSEVNTGRFPPMNVFLFSYLMF
jgi:hypothetical protein